MVRLETNTAAGTMASPHAAPQGSPDYLAWDSESRPIAIQLRANLIAELQRASPEQPMDGILLGDWKVGRRPVVQIDLCLPVQSGFFEGEAAGDPERLLHILSLFKDHARSRIVGYFRSRALTDRSPHDSEHDLMRRFFNSVTDVLLVVDTAEDKFAVDFFVWDGGRLRAYGPETEKGVVSERLAGISALRRMHRALLGVMVLVIIMTALYRPVREAARRLRATQFADAPPVNLTIDRSGPDYIVSWSPELGRRYTKSFGTLEVDSGTEHKAIPIGHELLSSGHISYRAGFQDVRFRLSAILGNGRNVTESVQTVSPVSGGAEGRPLTVPAAGASPIKAEPLRHFPSWPQGTSTPAVRRVELRPRERISVQAQSSMRTRRSVVASVPVPQVVQPAAMQVLPAVVSLPSAITPPPFAVSNVDRPRPGSVRRSMFMTASPRVKREVPLAVPSDIRRLIHSDLSIRIKASIDAAGHVLRTVPLTEGGYVETVLSHAAEENTRKWLFSPATVDGKPVPSEFLVQYTIKARAAF